MTSSGFRAKLFSRPLLGVVMRFILSPSARRACPSCGSANIRRSNARGPFEVLLRSVFQIKPYRCQECDDRHFRFRPNHAPTQTFPTASK